MTQQQKQLVRSLANMAATCQQTIRKFKAQNLPCEYAEGFLKGFIQSAKYAAWSFKVQNLTQ